MSRILNIAGGLLIAISVFLAFVSVAGQSVTMFGTEETKGRAIFFIVLGVVCAVVGLVNKRWLNILSLLIGLGVAALTFKYKGDASDMQADAGIGIWVMMGGGILAAIGGIMGVMNKGTSAAA